MSCASLARVFGRCLASCVSCCRGRRSDDDETQTKSEMKSSPKADKTSMENRQEVAIELPQAGAGEEHATATDDVAHSFSQMERELAASLENLAAAGRN